MWPKHTLVQSQAGFISGTEEKSVQVPLRSGSLTWFVSWHQKQYLEHLYLHLVSRQFHWQEGSPLIPAPNPPSTMAHASPATAFLLPAQTSTVRFPKAPWSMACCTPRRAQPPPERPSIGKSIPCALYTQHKQSPSEQAQTAVQSQAVLHACQPSHQEAEAAAF